MEWFVVFDGGGVVVNVVQFQVVDGFVWGFLFVEQKMGFGRGKMFGKFGDLLEGDLGVIDDGKDGYYLFEWFFYVQQDYYEVSDGGWIG